MRTTVYISPKEASDSKAAKKLAVKRLSDPNMKVSSIQPNRGRGGWTVCFKEATEK